jgi:DNA polymerase-3 subunit gamma/tau
VAYQSLYRRYRSRNFAEVLGQPHVTSGLRSAVAENRYGHAYLFSGPRGTGKTSTARVLAKALNCDDLTDGEPCGQCASCLAIEGGTSFDLHELDAASHNKVDDMRELISKVQLGSPGRTKVYILDEVHMLSSGAENALLKTLEEPPPHVVFVLATTEPHKVVPTIRSRTQHFEFHLLPADELAAHVRWVIEDAGLDVDEEAIDYVLRQGGGSARDTLSALDLVAAAGGVPAGTDVAEAVVRAIGNGEPAKAIEAIQTGLELGREPRTIGEETLELLRNAFLASMGAPLDHLNDRTQTLGKDLASELGPATLTRSLEAIGQTLVDMRQAPDPRVPLEVTLLRLTRNDATDPTALAARIEKLEKLVADLQAGGTVPARGDSGHPVQEQQPAQARRPAAAERTSSTTTTTARDRSGGGDRRPRSPRAGRSAPAQEADQAGQEAQLKQAARSEQAAQSEEAQPEGAEPARELGPAGEQAEPTSTTQAEAAGSAPASGDEAISLQAVTHALAAQLDQLSQRVRVRFKAGRVIDVEGTTITFAAPNSIHRDRCADVKDEVEQALGAQLGRPVTLELVIDETPNVPTDPAKLDPTPDNRQLDDSEDDIGPVAELADATDQSANSIERITKAFPGSQVVETPSD